MPIFTVSGVFPRPEYQRHTQHIIADSALEAERQIVREQPELIVASIIAGAHQALDAAYTDGIHGDGQFPDWEDLVYQPEEE
jgi:hypothetical protein